MSLTRTIRRSLLLSGLVLLPLAWAPLDAFSKDHAFLINASPSLPNWAFWLDKHAPIERGSLIFFEPPQSELLERHFGKGPQMFGKRVLGMPGDVVRHEGDAVFINGKQVASLLEVTRLGVPLTRGPEGAIPEGCYYKQQYRFQTTNPNPATKGRYACPPIGASTTFQSPGQVIPAMGEDMGYLVWRKRNCCAL